MINDRDGQEPNMSNDDAKADPEITVTDELDPADVAVITDGLRAYNLSQTGYQDFRPLAVFVRDPQTGKVVGGLHGRSEFGDGRRRGQAARLHSDRADDAQRRGAGVLPETGL